MKKWFAFFCLGVLAVLGIAAGISYVGNSFDASDHITLSSGGLTYFSTTVASGGVAVSRLGFQDLAGPADGSLVRSLNLQLGQIGYLANGVGVLTNSGSGVIGYSLDATKIGLTNVSGIVDDVWTNSNGNIGIVPFLATNKKLFIGPYTGFSITNAEIVANVFGNPSSGDAFTVNYSPATSGKIPAAVIAHMTMPFAGFTLAEGQTFGFFSQNETTNADSAGWLYGGDAVYGVQGSEIGIAPANSGAAVGVNGFALAKNHNTVGVSGLSSGVIATQTNIGVAGISLPNGQSGQQNIGGYFEVAADNSSDPTNLFSSVLFADNRTLPNTPLFVGRQTGAKVFQVASNGDLSTLKGVAYSWPSSSTGGVLSNNASGTLTWIPVETIITNNTFNTINSTTITSVTNTFNIAKGGNLILTNTISYITNVWPQGPTGVVQVATNYVQNFNSLTACSITGITGKSANQFEQVWMTFFNTSATNWVLTLAGGFIDLTGVSTHTVTNGQNAVLWIVYNPNGGNGPETNCFWFNQTAGGGAASVVVAGTNGISVGTNGSVYTVNFTGVNPLIYGGTNYSVTMFGTNTTGGELAIDGFGQLTQYSTNAGLFKLYDANTNVTVNLDGSTGNGTFKGVVTVTNGVATYNSNLSAPVTITVGASPFSWTNVTGLDIQVFIDANGATDTLALNGTTIFTSLANADHTVKLQNNEFVTVTYSVATPKLAYH